MSDLISSNLFHLNRSRPFWLDLVAAVAFLADDLWCHHGSSKQIKFSRTLHHVSNSIWTPQKTNLKRAIKLAHLVILQSSSKSFLIPVLTLLEISWELLLSWSRRRRYLRQNFLKASDKCILTSRLKNISTGKISRKKLKTKIVTKVESTYMYDWKSMQDSIESRQSWYGTSKCAKHLLMLATQTDLPTFDAVLIFAENSSKNCIG